MRNAAAIFLGAAAVVSAQESPVPAPVTAEDIPDLLERPPFRRFLSLPDSLVLSGVATLPAGRVVTVWDRRSDTSYVVTSTPNAQGWRLVELNGGSDLRTVSATIAAGTHEVVVRFDPERLIPQKLDNDSRPGGRSESAIVVEALLRSLDPDSARTFESLPPEPQEDFRKSFARFLDTYPDASDGQRIDFVRRTLAGFTSRQSPGDGDAAGTPDATGEGPPFVPGAAPAPAPDSPPPPAGADPADDSPDQ